MGGMLGNKRQDRGKKISGGQKFWAGTFGGNAKKKGGNFLGGSVGGAVNPTNFRGEFFEKCQRKNLGGKFGG